MKLLKTKDKGKLLKAARDKWYITKKEIWSQVTTDFSVEIMEAGRKGHSVFQVLQKKEKEKKKNCQLGELSFRNEVEIKNILH